MSLWKRVLVLAVAFSCVSLLAACGKKEPLSADRKDFAGKWVAPDSTYVVIYLDGGGDLKTSNSSVEGGSATFKDNKLEIGMGPIKKEFTIDEAPKQQANGAWTVKLDGNVYTKAEPGATGSNSTDTSTSTTTTDADTGTTTTTSTTTSTTP